MSIQSQPDRAARKFLTSAALLAALVCATGATLVASAATSPAMAQDVTGAEQKQKIDELQHAIDPKHYPAPKKEEKKAEEEKKDEPSFFQKCINLVCSLFSGDEEQEKKDHEEAVKKAVEERRQAEQAQNRLESQKTTEAPKTEVKKLETKTTVIKASQILEASTTKLASFHPANLKATSLKVESTRFEAIKTPAAMARSIAIAAPKPLTVAALAHPFAASTLTTRFTGLTVMRK